MWSWVSQGGRAKEGKKRKRDKDEGGKERGRGLEEDRRAVDTEQQNRSGFCSLCRYNNRGLEVNACLKWEHFLYFAQ